MQIDLTAAVKIGSLTLGGGLASVFDGDNTTVGYVQATSGYAGVTLSAPKRIDRVEVSSAENGFDASGLETAITLQLYGKIGAAPSSATDGVLLGSAAFTDQNMRRTVTVGSSDKSTEFNHIWVRVVTGVWSILAELRVFEAGEVEPLPEPEPLPPGMHMLLKSCDDAVALTHCGAELPQFRIQLLLAEPRKVAIDFSACTTHTGLGADFNVAVGYSFRICHRSAKNAAALVSAPFIEHPNAADGGNILNRTQHYGNAAIVDGMELPAGLSEISVIGSGHTDGSSTPGLIKMLVEGGKGLNRLRILVLP